jgi:hypothetical protein
MLHIKMRLPVVAVCVLILVCANVMAAQAHASDAKAIEPLEGIWSGSWGGEERDGVIYQPVVAELLIKGDYVELCGFRNTGRLTGTVRFDARAKRMYITPEAGSGDQPKPKEIEYSYVIRDDELTLTDTDKVPISLQRRRAEQFPLANAQLEVVAAIGINDAGDLLVTEFRVLRAGQAGGTYYYPQDRTLKTEHATVLLAQETGLKKLTVDEARGLIRKAMPVVMTYRRDERTSPHQFSELLQDMGSPMSDSEAVGQTLSRLLRPGTLIFDFPASESIPPP